MKPNAQMRNPVALAGANGANNAKTIRKAHDNITTVGVSNIDFIAHAFYRCGTDETPLVTGFHGDPSEVHHAMWGGRSALPLPRYIRADNNNYIAVSTFKRGTDGQFHRRKDCFAGLYIIMVDDVGTKVPFPKLALSPTCLVETSPGNFQAWYFLTKPERDRSRAESLIKGMIASGLTADGSDPGMNGVTRYGRLPIGVNGKSKYVAKLGAPFVQRVAAWSPTTRYSMDDIAAAYAVDMTVSLSKLKKPRPARKASPTSPSSNADGFLDIIDEAGLYLEPLGGLPDAHHIVCPWVHEHTDEDPTGTVYFEPSEENDWRGGFKCHHGHCQGRTIADLSYFFVRLLQHSA